ncbi:MAG: helix-turn-helix domain-containing protein, partial [Planctomycetes bacterium]|nr:helix-turn-helix domain-containing protein [Planctomycetota bacterium]
MAKTATELEDGDLINLNDAELFGKMPLAIYRTYGLTPTEKIVLGRLIMFAGKNGVCFPSYETLAEEVAMTRRYVIKIVNSLERKKLIVKDIHVGRNGGIRYHFLYHPIYKGYGFVDSTRTAKTPTKTAGNTGDADQSGKPTDKPAHQQPDETINNNGKWCPNGHYLDGGDEEIVSICSPLKVSICSPFKPVNGVHMITQKDNKEKRQEEKTSTGVTPDRVNGTGAGPPPTSTSFSKSKNPEENPPWLKFVTRNLQAIASINTAVIDLLKAYPGQDPNLVHIAVHDAFNQKVANRSLDVRWVVMVRALERLTQKCEDNDLPSAIIEEYRSKWESDNGDRTVWNHKRMEAEGNTSIV